MKYFYAIIAIFGLIFNFSFGETIVVSDVQTLQNAVGELRSGDSILIDDGVYNLTSTLVINNKPTKISNVLIGGLSGDRNKVEIYCPGMGVESQTAPHCFAIYNAEDVEIRDLTCGKTYWHPITIQGAAGAERPILRNLRLVEAGEQFVKINNREAEKCDGGLIEDCLIEYYDYPHWKDGYYYTQGIDKIGGGDDWVVRSCTVRNIRPHPEHAGQAEGCGAAITFWQGGSNNLIEKCLILNCRKGIEIGLGDGGGIEAPSLVRNCVVYRAPGEIGGDIGILVNDSPGTKIYNNTVILNGTFDPGSGSKTMEYRFDGSRQCEFVNNLCDGEIWHRTFGLDPTISYNFFEANSEFFVDEENHDFRLVFGAKDAIDQGTTLPEVPDDFLGTPRPVGAAYDIGAFEHDAPGKVDEGQKIVPEVFPNPARDFVVINFEYDQREAAELKIIGISGKTVFRTNIFLEPGAESLLVPTDSLDSGEYTAIICSTKGFFSCKFVLAK